MSEKLVCWVATEPMYYDGHAIEFHPDGPAGRESRDGVPMRRAPEFDAHAPGPVPVRVLYEAGWTVTCYQCEHELDEDGCLHCPDNHADAGCAGCVQCGGPPDYEPDVEVVFDSRGRAYCGPGCLGAWLRRLGQRSLAG